jgi:hypothetical protein
MVEKRHHQYQNPGEGTDIIMRILGMVTTDATIRTADATTMTTDASATTTITATSSTRHGKRDIPRRRR